MLASELRIRIKRREFLEVQKNIPHQKYEVHVLHLFVCIDAPQCQTSVRVELGANTGKRPHEEVIHKGLVGGCVVDKGCG